MRDLLLLEVTVAVEVWEAVGVVVEVVVVTEGDWEAVEGVDMFQAEVEVAA